MSKTRTRRPLLGMKPRTLRSFIEEINQPDPPDEPMLERIQRYADAAREHATLLLPQREQVESPMLFAIFHVHLRRDVRELERIPTETRAAWPRGQRRYLGSRSADSALDVIINFAADVMRTSAPLGLDHLADFIIAPKPAPVFAAACREWMKRINSGHVLPRPIDWPLWKLTQDAEDIADQLAKEVQEMMGRSTTHGTVVPAADEWVTSRFIRHENDMPSVRLRTAVADGRLRNRKRRVGTREITEYPLAEVKALWPEDFPED